MMTLRLFLPLILLFFLLAPQPTLAYVSGGSGKILLSPASGTMTTAQQFTVDILFHTQNTAISGISLQLTFSGPDELEITQVTPNTALSGWSFPVNYYTTSGNTTKLDLMALNINPSGFSTSANTALATISFRALKSFTGKTIQFEASQTKMIAKVDASDILSSLTEATFNASGTVVAPSPTPTPSPTPQPTGSTTTNPTPTPTTPASTPTTTPKPKTGIKLPSLKLPFLSQSTPTSSPISTSPAPLTQATPSPVPIRTKTPVSIPWVIIIALLITLAGLVTAYIIISKRPSPPPPAPPPFPPPIMTTPSGKL